MPNSQHNTSVSAIPITLGIIGHLDAIITTAHNQAFIELLDNIYACYPKSPVVLFSQLAIGADTKVAKIFLSHKAATRRDYRLVAVLPMPLADYKTDFNPDDLTVFEQLYANAHQHIEVCPPKKPANKSNANDVSDEINRPDLYRQGAKFVADSSLILIALYNGVVNHKAGGTGDIVHYKKIGNFFDDDTEFFDENGALIELSCQRKSDASIDTSNMTAKNLQQLLEDATIEKSLKKIEHYNQFQQREQIAQSELIKQSGTYLYSDPDKNLNVQANFLKQCYALVDACAIVQQQGYNLFLRSMFLLSFIFIALFEIYQQVGFNRTKFVAIMMFVGITLMVYKFSNKWQQHKNYLEDRTLAEALRVQFFWHLAGINYPVARHILRVHKEEHNWLSHLLHSLYGLSCPVSEPAKTELVKTFWITDQKQYFYKKLIQLESKRKLFNWIAKIAIVMAFILLIAVFILDNSSTGRWIIVIDTILFGTYAVIRAYHDKRGYDAIYNQYKLMYQLFKHCESKLTQLENANSEVELGKMQKILYKVGRESLIEVGNWHTLYKQREPSFEG